MDTPEIILKKGSITKLKVDAMVVPCDVHISNNKANSIIQDVIESANRGLIKEITSIGYCEIGNAVITKGYNLNAEKLIFMPYCDIENENYKANFSQLHLSFRSVFNLASLYEVNSISIPVFFRNHLEDEV